MKVDYALVSVVILAVILLIIWIIRRNIKDRKKYERDSIQSEIKPEKHDSDHV